MNVNFAIEYYQTQLIKRVIWLVALLIQKNRKHKELESILGVADSGGELMFRVKWKGHHKIETLPAYQVNERFTDKVVEFYEKRLKWHAKASMQANRSDYKKS